ncbi:hypothetical protein [Curtobacterium sp. PhB115]|uniref:hypothetical protein n=1 Tax=Curtobacterium sp. PhB115 TaxID=2485173 RepID=UPI000F4BBBA7|nr:hypothetical protein [Curtobacterium sp. PhB115]ROP60685.1 hypothetical protein EDF19_3573 [Curtobacterium sp. PhB115]
MSPFTARCVLVGAALVLVLAGVLGPVSGSARVVLLAAGACCAVLDVAVHRTATVADTDEPTVVVVEPSQVGADARATEVGASEDRESDVGDLDRSSFDIVTPSLVLGHRPDGTALRAAPDAHVVVTGAGVLAVAVFRAIAEQVRELAEPGDEVRQSTTTDLPDGTAVVARVDRAGTARGTVVLVAGLGSTPREWDVAVHVTRYGCSVRRPDDRHGTVVRPVLPLLRADAA